MSDGIRKVGDNSLAVGDAATASRDQQHAAAVDALRAHDGNFVLALETPAGTRVMGTYGAVGVGVVPEDAAMLAAVGDELAVQFLRRIASELVHASQHYRRRRRG